MTIERSQENRDIDPLFKEKVLTGIETAFEMYDALGVPIGMSPRDLTEYEDPREFIQLLPSEQHMIRNAFFFSAGFHPQNTEQVATYSYSSPIVPKEQSHLKDAVSGEVAVEIFTTMRREQSDMYMHRTTDAQGNVDYFIAPQDFRL